MAKGKGQKAKVRTARGASFHTFYFLPFTFDFAQEPRGQALLTAVIFLLFASVSVLAGLAAIGFREMRSSRIDVRAKESYFLSEAGVEDVLYRLRTNKQVGASETLALGGSSAAISVSASGTDRVIAAEGSVAQAIRRVRTIVRPNAQEISFRYGAQVGEGGLEMENNSRVRGSVYSNGSIIGDSGAAIDGDAFVAVGTLPTLNQSWETQNSEVAIGIQTGSIITVVDSAGSVGSYTSLGLGSDGLARISYVDESNFDLKFSRCTNADCTSRVITTVDSAGDIDEVTSLTFGADGLPRISYYHDGNDDLKFARCTSADCSSRVLTVVEAPNNTGDFSSLRMASDGFARIAYWYHTGRDVRFARCLNADCTSRNIATVDSVGDVGEYISLALGADGFGRMSYYDATNGQLRFARCTNADCTAWVITVVDSAGNVGQFTSLVLGSDGFARISYFDVSNGDLKFVRCTNADCSTRNIATVDSAGTVGHYTSIALGQDGFPRISYYDSSNGDLKFARCLDADCSSARTTTVDNASSVGLFTSLAIGADGFGRISYWAQSDRDLRYVRCTAADCPPPLIQADVAQSFQPSMTSRIVRVDLLLRKVGNPSNATLRIITDSGGRPSGSAVNVLTVGTLNAALVGSSYAWVSVWLTTTPTLSADNPYWVVFDGVADEANYYVWGADASAGYTRGNALASEDWQSRVWTALAEDLDFRVFMGGVDHEIRSVSIGGSAASHVANTITVGGNVNAFNFSNGTVGGNVSANSISNCTIGGNAAFNGMTGCTISGSQTTPTTPPADPPAIPLPIATSTIDQWKADAEAGGVCVPPQCRSNGDFDPSACSVSLGPKKIVRNIILDASCSGGQALTVTGTIWVSGNIDISNNARIVLSSGYGTLSGVILSDGRIHLSNNGQFRGSGTAGSYLMLLSTATGGGHHGSAIDLHNNASGAIFYAGNGMIFLHQNVRVTELVGRTVHLENNAELIYEQGLANARFSAGPTGGWSIRSWNEVR